MILKINVSNIVPWMEISHFLRDCENKSEKFYKIKKLFSRTKTISEVNNTILVWYTQNLKKDIRRSV